MTNYKPGDIVLVNFGFSEGAGPKKRPSLIISNSDYHKSLEEVILAAITSNIKRVLFGDTKIDGWKAAGLLYPSLVTAIIRTVKANVIIRKLGAISKQDFQEIKKNLMARKIIERNSPPHVSYIAKGRRVCIFLTSLLDDFLTLWYTLSGGGKDDYYNDSKTSNNNSQEDNRCAGFRKRSHV